MADLNDPNFNQDTGQNLEGNVLKVTAPTSASTTTTTVTVTPGPSPGQETLTTTTPAAPYKSSAAPGVAMTADECDINSFTEGRNNAVSLANKNTWVWTDNNTWVHGNSNSSIKGDSDSEIQGVSHSTIC